ncbi:uncharacterized protein FIBRA_06421 [Fibroporia radiculosa]|uniref:RNB domain-containing protein n=1 Tax=Fibroporia radiculosa TaxID=599839 RepID=J4H425_9APHY|nr:uncharacterized protein FIBRA_06421 [Fibroporia radiculosa]CCM04254.1 predicted protein [Fibroporia radiculosa]
MARAIQGLRNPTISPSLDKQQFYSNPVEDWDPNLQQLDVVGKQRFKPGTMVEIRRSEITAHGVVLFDIPIEGQWVVHTLTSGGEVWAHGEQDVMFAVSEFVPIDLIKRCGVNLVVQSDAETYARVEVLRRLRGLVVAQERKLVELFYPLRQIYEHFKHRDPKQWSEITTDRAARFLDPNSQTPSVVTMFAVHSYLFARYRQFVADRMNFLTTRAFWIRPQQDVDDISAVDSMVLDKDPRLESFIQKAKRLIAAAKLRTLKTWRQPMSYEQDLENKFTPDDMRIIRYMQSTLRQQRTIQANAYIVSLATIMKRIGGYDLDRYDSDGVFRLLVDMGVLSPWQDQVSYEWSASESLGWQQKMQTSDDLSARGASPASLPLPPRRPLGPNDFYSHDVVDSLRHDFGDMPVYVIDDVQAHELDDGLSIERIPNEPDNFWLHVHIADPTSVLPPSHFLAQRALDRNQTSYFINRTIPLLPLDSFGSLSLRENASQRVMTFSAKTGSDGRILDYRVRPGIVKNVHIVNYSGIDSAMQWDVPPFSYPFGVSKGSQPLPLDLDESMRSDMSLLREIATRVSRNRVKNGAVTMLNPFVTISAKSENFPQVPPCPTAPYLWSGFPQLEYGVNDQRASESGARLVVAESMRTASRVASMFFRDRGVPTIRRVVQQPTFLKEEDQERLLTARDESGFLHLFDSLDIGVMFSPAEYRLAIGPHWVLGIPEDEGYVRVTSPLRRFNDLLTHWQIKYALLAPTHPSPCMFDNAWLTQFARNLAMKERRDKRIALGHEQYWAHVLVERWMKERHLGWRDGPDPLDSLTAIVLSHSVFNSYRQQYQYHALIPELGLKARLAARVGADTIPVGAKIAVKIQSLALGFTPLITVVPKPGST